MCKCNSCKMGFNGLNGHGYQPCASNGIPKPPTPPSVRRLRDHQLVNEWCRPMNEDGSLITAKWWQFWL